MEQTCQECRLTYDTELRSCVCPHNARTVEVTEAMEAVKLEFDKIPYFEPRVRVHCTCIPGFFKGKHLKDPRLHSGRHHTEQCPLFHTRSELVYTRYKKKEEPFVPTVVVDSTILSYQLEKLMSRVPVRNSTMGPVDFMLRQSEYIDEMHTLLNSWIDSRNELGDPEEEDDFSGSSYIPDKDSILIRLVAQAAFKDGVKFENGDVQQGFDLWWEKNWTEEPIIESLPENKPKKERCSGTALYNYDYGPPDYSLHPCVRPKGHEGECSTTFIDSDDEDEEQPQQPGKTKFTGVGRFNPDPPAANWQPIDKSIYHKTVLRIAFEAGGMMNSTGFVNPSFEVWIEKNFPEFIGQLESKHNAIHMQLAYETGHMQGYIDDTGTGHGHEPPTDEQFKEWYRSTFTGKQGASELEPGASGCTCGSKDDHHTPSCYSGQSILPPDLPTTISLVDLCLSILRLEIRPEQLKTLKTLDEGRTALVQDVTGAALRIRKDNFTGSQFDSVTSANITYDIERYIKVELPKLLKAHQLQSFADDLLVYLRKKGWSEHQIYPAIQDSVTLFSRMQQGGSGDGVRLESSSEVQEIVQKVNDIDSLFKSKYEQDEGDHLN